jgi:hypothetical protein
MRNKFGLALALVLAGYAGSASAQLVVGAADPGEPAPNSGYVPANEVNTNQTWSGTVILNEPIFVKAGATLTISPGTIVRGQPRQAAVAAGIIAGTPGALIATQQGRIRAVGTPTQPIVFTTAAVDNVAPFGAADNVDANPGFLDPGNFGSTFLDATPTTNPLSPLNSQGVQNVALWGGVVLLGNAPTNLSNFQGVGYGQAEVEGLSVPGYPVADARFGGVDPHDNSGTFQYVSLRHAGDEIGNSNELNGLTLAGVGDGTKISFVEIYTNFDDGLEIFGGTVDTDHVVSSFLGDDSFDLDQGYTGINQFWLALQGNFNQDSGANYGTSSGDKGGEFDGDDYIFDPMQPLLHNTSTRFQLASTPGPAATTDPTPWPLSNPAIYNYTVIGPAADGAANPAVSPLSAGQLAGKRGFDLRNGFAGKVFNAVVVNMGTGLGFDVRNGDGGAPGFDTETNNLISSTGSRSNLVAVVSSSFDAVAPIPGRDVAGASGENTALSNGDAIRLGLGASPTGTNSVSCVNDTRGTFPGVASAWAGLLQENHLINPKGSGNTGYLLGALATPVNPRPAFGVCGGNGVPAQEPGLDANATYRGAFSGSAATPLWTNGWTALNQGAVLGF